MPEILVLLVAASVAQSNNDHWPNREGHVRRPGMNPTNMNDAFRKLEGERLTSIEFILDYMQFRFDGPTFTILTPANLRVADRTIHSSQYGFKDEVCMQIGRTVTSALAIEGQSISLTFDGDAELQFTIAPGDCPGPEAGKLDLVDWWLVF